MKTVNGIDIGSLLMVEAEIPPVCHIETHEPSEPFLVPAELNLEPVEGRRSGRFVTQRRRTSGSSGAQRCS
jgi:hypothetical protein